MGSHSLAFKAWVKDEVIYCETPIDRFNNMTIGIDAEDYLHSILSPGNQAPEPLLPAHGGNGFTIKKRIDEDLERLRGAGIRPWFVFNGLDLASKDRASVLNESRKATTILDEAWTIYDKGEGENAVIAFGKACMLIELLKTCFLATKLTVLRHVQDISHSSKFDVPSAQPRRSRPSCSIHSCGTSSISATKQ